MSVNLLIENENENREIIPLDMYNAEEVRYIAYLLKS